MTTPTIDREFRALIPALSEDERGQLEANLVRDGCRDPLVLWKGNILLDGHNRFEICERLDIRYRTITMALADRCAARIWIRWNQLGRRNLTDDMRALQVAGLVEDLTAQSKRARASAAGKTGGRFHAKAVSLSETSSGKLKKKRDVRRATSKRAQVSEHKVRQAQTLKKRAPELAEKVAQGELTLAEATRQTKPARRAERLAEIVWPTDRYGLILADPPWRPDEGVLDPSRRIENQYPTMSLDELLALKPKIDRLALDDSILVMWTTAQKLADAVLIVSAWGFTIKSGAVWVKGSIGMGYWFRQRHELIVLATRGAPMTPLEADRPDSVLEAPRGKHSEKPTALYALLERMFPQIPKIEIFARAHREGWAPPVTNETTMRSA